MRKNINGIKLTGEQLFNIHKAVLDKDVISEYKKSNILKQTK